MTEIGFTPVTQDRPAPDGPGAIGFIPAGNDEPQYGFIPAENAEPGLKERLAPALKTVEAVGSVYPVVETAANLGSQAIALPVAGIAGMGTAATNAMGLTDTPPEDVVHAVGNALTYHPKTELGQHLTNAAMYPFELLAKGGQYAGDKTLAATDSPMAATAVDTAVNALPMAIAPGIRGAKTIGERIVRLTPEQAAVARKAESDAALGAIGSAETVDEAIALANKALDLPADPVVSEMASPVPVFRGTPVTELADADLAKFSASPYIPLEEIQRRQQATVPDELAQPSEGALGFRPLAEETTNTPAPPDTVTGNAGEQVPLADAQRSARVHVREEELGDTVPTAMQLAFENAGLKTDLEKPEVSASREAMHPGENYIGFRSDALESADVPPSAKPLTREDVLVPLAKALGTSIYEGRVKGKALGTYTEQHEVVRIKHAADIETAAHEIAHLLDDRIPAIRKVWALGPDRKLFADELNGVSYDKKNVKEGFAEFVRLYMTQPEEARARVPNFNHWFDGFIRQHEYGPAILKAREGMQAWFGQNALDRARSKIGANKKLSEAMDGVWDRFRQSVSDDLHGVYRMERDLTGKINSGGSYESARLARASHSITDGAIRYGSPVKRTDGSFTYAGKGLEEIIKPVSGNLDDALLYFVGRSARELQMQGREHLFTPGEIKSMVALETPEVKIAFNEYQKWNKGILDFAEAQGVVNPAARAMWQRQSYMPFHRVGQAGEWKGGKPGEWSGIKALTGGTENLRDILGNMVGNAATLIDKAVKNEARQKIAQLAESQRGGGRFMTEIPKESKSVRISSEQVLEGILKAIGINRKGKVTPAIERTITKLREQLEQSPESFEFMLHDQAPAGGNVVAVLEGGKPRYFEVADPILMRALSSIDRKNQHWLVHWLGYPKRVGQLSITLTPDFMVRNISRDTLMGAVMSRAGFRPVMDSLEGMRLRMTNDPLYKDYIANGGGLSSIYLDEEAFRAKLERFYSRKGIDYRTVLDTPEKLLSAVESIADAFEMSTRLGEYSRAIKAGENPRHAAYLGREISTDFAMRGDSQALGLMYDTVMFLKPAVVSFDRLARGLMHDPNRGAIATKAGLMALASMALYLLNRSDPRYQDIEDWKKDGYWHFFVVDQHFMMPKTWEIGAMASVAERSLEKLLSHDPEGLGKDMVRILGATFSVNLMPQLVAPLVEQATNRNSFTGAPIETPGMQEVQPFLRAKPSTSETMKAAGMATRDLPESLQVNPVRAEALLRGYFNTWAIYGLQLTDQAFFRNQLPEGRADELPVVRSFYQQEPAKHTRYETIFYNMLNEAQRLRGTLKALDKMGRPDLADQKEKSPLAGEAKPLEKASENLRGINKDMDAVRRDQSLTPAEKRQKTDALTVERNALLKAIVTDAQHAQQEAKP